MENTYLISDFSENLKHIADLLKIPESNVISFVRKQNEKEFHEWLQDVFTKNDIKKIIMPISLSNDIAYNTEGLLLGLHIRLNYQLSVDKRCIPIIYLSNFSIENIIKANNFDKDNNPQNLLFTKGVYFTSFDLDDIKKTIENALPCSLENYEQNLLPRLNIQRKATSGGHDIANAWGGYKLGLIIGVGDTIFNEEYASKYLKQLYAKYLICKNEIFDHRKMIDLKQIKCFGKKVLFIDDKADEGWGVLMKKVFNGAGKDFVCVDPSKYKTTDEHRSFSDFDGFYKECQSHIGKDWDLIIIDLRLNPETEDIDNKTISPTNLTGYKLINEFLYHNAGYQIIVLTASNKIWNINAALDRGAYSYYIKESPDFNFPIKETQIQFEDFKADVQRCFERGYLRDLYKEWYNAKSEDSNSDKDFIAESAIALDIAWEQIKNEYLDFAFLTLFQSVESIANKLYIVEQYEDYLDDVVTIDKTESNNFEWLLAYKEDHNNGSYFYSEKLYQNNKQKPTTLYKISCLFKIKYEKDDSFLKKIGSLNKIRNSIAHHGSKSFAEKENLIDLLQIIEELRSI